MLVNFANYKYLPVLVAAFQCLSKQGYKTFQGSDYLRDIMVSSIYTYIKFLL